MSKFNLNWENNCLFVLANIGDANLFEYWLDKKKLNIDAQDEDGDTPLHYAVRGGHIELVIELLKRNAVISLNKKKRTALQDAYALNQIKITKEITKFVIQRNSIKNIVPIQGFKKDIHEHQRLKLLVDDFINCLRKNYLDRNIFIRFPAKHNERAKALIAAALRCKSIKDFQDLLNNQLNLFKSTPKQPLPKRIIEERWSKCIRNKPLNVNNSQFYKTLNTFVAERFCNNNVINRSVKSALYR